MQSSHVWQLRWHRRLVSAWTLGIVICHNHNEDQSEAECEPQAARWLVFVLVPDSQPLKHWHL